MDAPRLQHVAGLRLQYWQVFTGSGGGCLVRNLSLLLWLPAAIRARYSGSCHFLRMAAAMLARCSMALRFLACCSSSCSSIACSCAWQSRAWLASPNCLRTEPKLQPPLSSAVLAYSSPVPDSLRAKCRVICND